MQHYDIQMYKMFVARGPGLPPGKMAVHQTGSGRLESDFYSRGTQIVPSGVSTEGGMWDPRTAFFRWQKTQLQAQYLSVFSQNQQSNNFSLLWNKTFP